MVGSMTIDSVVTHPCKSYYIAVMQEMCPLVVMMMRYTCCTVMLPFSLFALVAADLLGNYLSAGVSWPLR